MSLGGHWSPGFCCGETPCRYNVPDEAAPAPGYESCPTGDGCSVHVGEGPDDVRAAAIAAHVGAAHGATS